MDRNDRLSITAYNSNADDLIAQDDLRNKQRLRQFITRVYPTGGTNISAGLRSNADLLRFGEHQSLLGRVVLMSDGLATDGATEINSMVRIVKQIVAQGLTVSTIGLGRDYDEEMLRAIAEAGNGNYYYVESPAQAPLIFDQEVRGLQMTIAEDLAVNLVGADGNQVEILNELDATDDGFQLGLMRYDESIALVGKFTIPRAQVGEEVELGAVQLIYKDRESGALVLLNQTVSVEVSSDGEVVSASLNPAVTAERTLVETEALERQAVMLAKAGDYEGARKSLQQGMDVTLGGQIAISNSITVDASGISANGESLGWTYGLNALQSKQEALEMLTETYMGDDFLGKVNVANSFAATNQALFNAQKGQRQSLLISIGDSGFEVERLEQALIIHGADSAIANGVFEDDDQSALEDYQRDNGLDVDGIAGPRTLRHIGIY